MSVEALGDQIAGIFARYEVPYSVRPDGSEYAVLRGSSAVFVTVHDSLGVPVVSLSSPVLQDIDMTGENYAKGLMIVNRLNHQQYFAKFYLQDDGLLKLEHDLLGTHLQGEELMASLDQISGMADHLDDHLQRELGGKPFEAKLEEAQHRAVDT